MVASLVLQFGVKCRVKFQYERLAVADKVQGHQRLFGLGIREL